MVAPSKMDFDNVNRMFERVRDVDILVVYISEKGFHWSKSLGSQRRLASDRPNTAFERLQNINAAAAERISKLARLEADWDGYGGEPIAQEAIDTAAGLLTIIHGLTSGKLQNPFIAPMTDGGLELEWELNSGVELTLIVPSGGRGIKYLLDVPLDSGDIEESEGLLPRDASLSELLIGRVL